MFNLTSRMQNVYPENSFLISLATINFHFFRIQDDVITARLRAWCRLSLFLNIAELGVCLGCR